MLCSWAAARPSLLSAATLVLMVVVITTAWLRGRPAARHVSACLTVRLLGPDQDDHWAVLGREPWDVVAGLRRIRPWYIADDVWEAAAAQVDGEVTAFFTPRGEPPKAPVEVGPVPLPTRAGRDLTITVHLAWGRPAYLARGANPPHAAPSGR